MTTREAGNRLTQAVKALGEAHREYKALKDKRRRPTAFRKWDLAAALVDECALRFTLTVERVIARRGHTPEAAYRTIAYMRARGMELRYSKKWESQHDS